MGRSLSPLPNLMAQFLLITTLLSIAGLLGTAGIGFFAGPGHTAQHIYMALATVVIGLFSQSMTMFFFIGTGKELKEASQQNPEVVARTKQFKQKVFPAAMYAMGVLMVTFIMGGGVASGKTYRWLHLVMAIASIVMYGRAYWIQLRVMIDNAELMEKYLKEAE